MKNNLSEVSKSHQFTSNYSVLIASTLMFLCSLLFFIESKNPFKSSAAFTALCAFCFYILYHHIIPRLIKSNSFFLMIFSLIVFTILSTAFFLIVYQNFPSLFPYPIHLEEFSTQIFIAIFVCISLSFFISALGVRLELNSYLISFEGYELLQKSYQSEINALKMQMNPHFISNALNNMNSLIRSGDIEKAMQYNLELQLLVHHQLSLNSTDELSLKEELDWIERYLSNEQKRLSHKFEYHISIETSDLLDFTLPPMILQPILENSIQHGFHPEKFEGKGVLSLKIIRKNKKSIKIIIEDNGLGIHAAKINRTRPSISGQSIDERIRLINEISNTHIQKKLSIHENGSYCEISISKGFL